MRVGEEKTILWRGVGVEERKKVGVGSLLWVFTPSLELQGKLPARHTKHKWRNCSTSGVTGAEVA